MPIDAKTPASRLMIGAATEQDPRAVLLLLVGESLGRHLAEADLRVLAFLAGEELA